MMVALADFIARPLPALNGTPWAHQVDAFRLAADRPGFLLGHDMGTGKGFTAITLLEHDQAQRVLILCPKNVVGVWPAQLNGPLDPPAPEQGFSPRHWSVWSGRVQGARGPKRNPSVTDRALALMSAYTDAVKLRHPFVAVVNYEASFQGDMRELLLGTPWDAVICDESHRLKLPSGRASRLATQVAQRVRDRGGRVLGLTGTPMPHSPLDIFAQMRILDGGQRLGTNYRAFCQRYGKAEEIRVAGGNVRTVYKDLRTDRVEKFTDTVGELMHTVSADEVLDLPESTDRHVGFDLSPTARRAYDELERYGIAQAGGGTLTASNAMVLVLRLAQATSGFGTDADTGRHVALDPAGTPDKARVLADLLEDLPTGEPVVVFCRFHADLDAVRGVAETRGRRYGELSGRRRDGLTADSKMAPDVDVLGCQLKSGGVGISLVRARIAIYYSLDFALAEHMQSRARLVRPGQTRPVSFTYLLADNTVDHAVLGALHKRRDVIDAVTAFLKSKQQSSTNGRNTP